MFYIECHLYLYGVANPKSYRRFLGSKKNLKMEQKWSIPSLSGHHERDNLSSKCSLSTRSYASTIAQPQAPFTVDGDSAGQLVLELSTSVCTTR